MNYQIISQKKKEIIDWQIKCVEQVSVYQAIYQNECEEKHKKKILDFLLWLDEAHWN